MLALVLAACSDPCDHSLLEFCGKSTADCRPYDQRVASARMAPACTNPDSGIMIELRTCNGRHFLTENDGFGGAEYAYDDIGKLAGVTTFSDTPLACGKNTETYGKAADCNAAPDETICVQRL